MVTTKLDTIELHDSKLELAVEVLRSGNAIRLRALGSSMLPTLWPQDVLTIEPVSEPDLHVGEVVLCLRQDRFFIHRLIVGGDAGSNWTTRGDALPNCDPPLKAEDILGHVSSVCRDGRILIPRRPTPVQRIISRAVCRSDLVRNLILRIHSLRLEFWRQREMLSDPDQLPSLRTI
jgi:hypothetical protein